MSHYQKVGSGGVSSADTNAVDTKDDTARLDPDPSISLSPKAALTLQQI